MTVFDFVSDMFLEDPYAFIEPIDIETATGDIEYFREQGYDIPEDMSPEEYMKAYNKIFEDMEVLV